ncbi:MAG: DUF58 domain-containing protein [Pseudomonadota bacterium]|nr:DUF58 domain-containing protein [Pseudomonadota bacterium]
MIPKHLLQEIRHLELKASYIANDMLTGEYLSAFKGQGMEFDEIRPYTYGDDIRAIDWNVTARMHYPHIKIFREERELTLMLIIDVSASQRFGSETKLKSERTAELAAVLAFLATRNNDKVGLLIFANHVQQYIPPQKGRAHVWQLIKTILAPQEFQQGTDIDKALEYLLRITKRKAMCFLISDFVTTAPPKSLALCAKRHDLVAVQVQDQREQSLPKCGLLDFVDSESGEVITVNTSDEQFRQAYAADQRERCAKLNKHFRRLGIDNFTINTATSVARPLIEFLHLRTTRQRR